MKCSYCGHLFEEDEGKKSCGGCPGGCHSIHCPRCNYKNPQEPELLKKIRRILNKNNADKGDAT